MKYDIYEESYYNKDEWCIIETREFDSYEEAKAYCDELTEKTRFYFYYADKTETETE